MQIWTQMKEKLDIGTCGTCEELEIHIRCHVGSVL